MTPNSEKTSKPKLTRRLLEEKKVFFVEDVCKSEDLLDWIQPIREQLVRPRRPLPRERREFSEELTVFRKSGQDRDEALRDSWSVSPFDVDMAAAFRTTKRFGKDSVAEQTDTELDECENIKNEAEDLRERNSTEAGWVTLLTKAFFKTFHEVHGKSYSYADILRQWEVQKDLLWNEFSESEARNPEIPNRTAPKPDFTYAFPIIDTTIKTAAKYLSDPRVENFSLPVLHALRRKEGNLLSAPTTGLQQWAPKGRSKLDAAHMICFPWAIVEVKRNKKMTQCGTRFKNSGAVFCYCQAANASAAALTLREQLASQSNDSSPINEALAIFALTCVGPSVKLWITYRTQEKTIAMQCIWATSLELTWGVLALRMVIKNMREWVFDRVKPEISRWIRMVRARPSPQTLLTPGGDMIRRTRRAVSCDPSDDRPDFTPQDSPSSVRRSNVAPLHRGKTAPERISRQGATYRTPIDLTRNESEDETCVEEEEESEESDDGNKIDNGNATYTTQSEEDDDESTEDSASDLGSQVESGEDLDALLEMSEIWYPPQKGPEIKRRQKKKVSWNEDHCSHAHRTDSEEQEGDSNGDEDTEYYIEERRYSFHRQERRARRSLGNDESTVKNAKSKTDRALRPHIRRRSSRF
ncbi:hypothetical protein BKA66DRAFT_569879 [Pyrenochaeta sp. MPI-SDFR-AT-0127]|nr:hypothetical protein BKA66DRAFT_569879 [Pyrenochaeta sp. MPI-SDFR-AT-0127]